MKVVIISHACIEPDNRRKIRNLKGKSNMDITLVVPQRWREGDRRIKFEKSTKDSFPIIPLPVLLKGKQFVYFYLGLGKHLKRIDPDIIHAEEELNSAAAFQVSYLKRHLDLRAKLVFFSWQNMKQEWRFPNPRFLFYPYFERYSLQAADHIIAGTPRGKAIWEERGFNRGISVIPQFGTDTEHFFRNHAIANKDPNEIRIGYVGRIMKMKGVFTLIKAVLQLPDNCKLDLVGSGPDLVSCKKFVKELKLTSRVSFRGPVAHPDIPDIFNKLDIFVLPSEHTPNWQEQFGRVLVEAMACEVPVIGSSCGEIPYVVGDTGLIFEEGNCKDLKSKLEMLVTNNDLRQKLAKKGRERAFEVFSDDRVVLDTYKLYISLGSTPREKSNAEKN